MPTTLSKTPLPCKATSSASECYDINILFYLLPHYAVKLLFFCLNMTGEMLGVDVKCHYQWDWVGRKYGMGQGSMHCSFWLLREVTVT